MLALKVWRGELDVPFSYREETQYYLMLAKSIEDHGGYFENPSLGAPFGQELQDFAVGTDRLNLDLLRFLLLFGSPAAAVNVFFLLTFPLAAAAAYLVFRLLGVSRAAGGGLRAAVRARAVPLRARRGEPVPDRVLGRAARRLPRARHARPATRCSGGGRARAACAPTRRARTLMTIAFCVAVASTGIYYAAFTLLLLRARP